MATKGVWVQVERITISESSENPCRPGQWRAVLLSPGKPYAGNIKDTPEQALSEFEKGFWPLWSANQIDYMLQTQDDYPDGITEYAIRFLHIPRHRLT